MAVFEREKTTAEVVHAITAGKLEHIPVGWPTKEVEDAGPTKEVEA